MHIGFFWHSVHAYFWLIARFNYYSTTDGREDRAIWVILGQFPNTYCFHSIHYFQVRIVLDFWISFYYKFVDGLYALNLILEDNSYVRFLIIFGQIFIHPWKLLSSLLCLPYLVGWVQVFCVLRAKYVFNLLLDFCFWGLQTWRWVQEVLPLHFGKLEILSLFQHFISFAFCNLFAVSLSPTFSAFLLVEI